ncbi:hypothetical protein [Roseofilum casamattae]|uniref:Uncharacterized protein n=1 Tax=Roseofilum casamattae BLCC-M143 TaxID=3022442 RepID=A0ABT7C1C6_9CYAN|nr:hypothetical protein [Roseofilum casamattae]MDJ1185265.1 hypothetical protein [Roseofilum casamattae BLCC-M143]
MKMICFSRGITQSEALEEALVLWTEANNLDREDNDRQEPQ